MSKAEELAQRLDAIPFIGLINERLHGQQDPLECKEAAALLRQQEAVIKQCLSEMQKFSRLYGHLFDTVDGRGYLSAEACERYDDVHAAMEKAIAAAKEVL